jgi:hypothetical protein
MVAIAARITVPFFLWQDIPAFPRSDFERLSGSFECFLLAALLALAGLLDDVVGSSSRAARRLLNANVVGHERVCPASRGRDTGRSALLAGGEAHRATGGREVQSALAGSRVAPYFSRRRR